MLLFQTSIDYLDPSLHPNASSEVDEQPLIVPPMLSKSVEGPFIFETQWRRAVNAIKNSEAIVFAGYSFPETDVFMTRLLAEGISANPRLQKVLIANPAWKNSAWQLRINDMFAAGWRSRRMISTPNIFSDMCRNFLRVQPMASREAINARVNELLEMWGSQGAMYNFS
ncbi:hypothetical protein B7486_16905 [cyanobacterium TDX16]|nr:hypothetical protein B7486_16905 [cyanobacterium TDX16]